MIFLRVCGGDRTRGLELGKLALYRLSYTHRAEGRNRTDGLAYPGASRESHCHYSVLDLSAYQCYGVRPLDVIV